MSVGLALVAHVGGIFESGIPILVTTAPEVPTAFLLHGLEGLVDVPNLELGDEAVQRRNEIAMKIGAQQTERGKSCCRAGE